MFGFLSKKKHDEVRTLLQGRMNRNFVRQMGNKDRRASRSACCEVVWLMPYVDGHADFSLVKPVVTKDMSVDGMALIHTESVDSEQVVIGLHNEIQPKFVLCTLEHCTRLGYGFYQIGVKPEEIVHVDPIDIEVMLQKLEQFKKPVATVSC